MCKISFKQITTKRLLLRRFQDSDLEPFRAYRFDPEIARYQGWDSCSRQEVIDFIQEQQSVQPGTPGQWFQLAIELRETGELVGDCGLHTHKDDARQADIGYTLARPFHGRGYATETVSRLLDYAFEDLAMHRIVGVVDCENSASVALLERLGLRREGHFIQNIWFKGKWGDEYLYAVLKDEWLAKRSGGVGELESAPA